MFDFGKKGEFSSKLSDLNV